MKRINAFAKIILLILFSQGLYAADTTILKSPDGQVVMRVFEQNRQLAFNIVFKNSVVITTSPMVFSIDGAGITTGATTGRIRTTRISEQYPWLGVHSTASNRCNATSISLRHDRYTFEMQVRIFNDGVAFRLVLPGSNTSSRIPDEHTTFKIPAGSAIWYHDLVGHYEGAYVKKQVTALNAGEWVAPPATYKLPEGFYASITEADLRNYAGMAFQADGKNGLVLVLANHQPASYPYKLRYSPEDTLRLSQPAVIAGTITTPWRVVMVGADLNAMVNNDIVHNLCPPPDKILFPEGIHTDWIKPGRAVWKYLDGGGDGTLEVMKKFSKEAAELGFENNILEGFWSRWTDDEIKDLVNYSKQLNVDIWVWKHSKSLRNESERLAFFKRCHDLGIAGVKIDFFDHEAKEVIDLYNAILKETAENKLLADFRGANKPTGQSRTWPNELTREAVKGMESSKFEQRASHEVTLPFTRFLAGPAEYTVVHFGDRRKNTTWTHQLASAVILSAPLLTYAANPENLLANPAVQVIKEIPATWDETIVLPGSEIGELAAFARRKKNTWFIAVMNGNEVKSIKIPLGFLKTGHFKTTVVSDVPGNPASVSVTSVTYTSTDVIDLRLEAGGGYIAAFSE